MNPLSKYLVYRNLLKAIIYVKIYRLLVIGYIFEVELMFKVGYCLHFHELLIQYVIRILYMEDGVN